MSAWPTYEFIRILKGHRKYYGPIDPVYAFRCQDGSYQLLTDGPDEGYLAEESGDRIDSWEGVVPVPANDLKNLRDEFRDAPIAGRRLSSILRVTSNLPPTPATPLDRAVSKVEEALSGSMTSLDASSEEYLALLLEALSSFQGLESGPASPEKRRALSRITRLCVEWVARIAYADSPCEGQGARAALAEVRGRVESDPAVGGFLTMASLAGDAASWVEEVRETGEDRSRLGKELPGTILTIAHYALALLAKNLEDGE